MNRCPFCNASGLSYPDPVHTRHNVRVSFDCGTDGIVGRLSGMRSMYWRADACEVVE